MTTAYCPTCRTHHTTNTNPPYAVTHINPTDTTPLQHVHPITRQPLPEVTP